MKSKSVIAFIKNSLLFLLGSVFSKLLNFILLPLYTTHIPTADFGMYDINTLYISLISSFLYFEIWSAVLRYMYDFEGSEKYKVVKSSLFIFGISTVAFSGVTIAFCFIIRAEYMWLIVAWGITTALATYMSFLARGIGKNIDFAISGILNTSTCLCVNIILILGFNFNYSSLYIASICGAIVQSIYLLFRLRLIRQLTKTVKDNKLTKELFKYALPLCLNTAAYWLLHSSARAIYNLIEGDSASGIYSVGNKFGTIIVLATTCFTYAWQDLSFSASKEAPDVKLYSVASKKYLLFLSSFLCVALPALKLVFPILIKGDYVEAINYVPLFLIVAVASGYSAFIGNIFYAIKSTKIISISTIISGVVVVGLAFPFIKLWGANGANIAVLIGFLLNIAIRFFLLKRKISFEIPILQMLFASAWIAATTVLYVFLNEWLNIAVCAVNLVILVLVFRKDIKKMFKGRKEETT